MKKLFINIFKFIKSFIIISAKVVGFLFLCGLKNNQPNNNIKFHSSHSHDSPEKKHRRTPFDAWIHSGCHKDAAPGTVLNEIYQDL